MRRTGTSLLAAIASLSLGGCLNPESWSYKSQYDEPRLLAVAGPVAVDVVSFNGDVSVIVDPRETYASVQVRRRALHGYGRSGEAKEALTRIAYKIDMERGESGPVLSVRTWTDDAEPHFLRADMRIRLPAVKGLTVKTQNGSVEAIGIDGPATIETSDGDVQLLTERPMLLPVTIVNQRGDIDYRAGGGSSGRFECEAVGGNVDQRMRIGRLIILAGTDNDSLLATLNDGQNPVRLHTTGGDIRIAVVPQATDVGTVIVSP